MRSRWSLPVSEAGEAYLPFVKKGCRVISRPGTTGAVVRMKVRGGLRDVPGSAAVKRGFAFSEDVLALFLIGTQH